MRIIILFFMFLGLSNSIFGQYSDAKFLGYKGDLEKVITKTYLTKVGSDSSQWSFDSLELDQFQEDVFNENNNIVKGFYQIYSSDDSEKISYVVKQKNKRKSIRTDDNIDGYVFKYHWIDDKSYNYTTENSRFLIDRKIQLNENYREISREVRVYRKKESTKEEIKYSKGTTIYQEDSEISHMEEYKPNTEEIKEKYALKIEVYKKDFLGNITEYAIIKNDTELHIYIVNEFYYKE